MHSNVSDLCGLAQHDDRVIPSTWLLLDTCSSVVKLVIGKFETTIYFKVGVKQVDSVAPVLFLFIVMAFADTLEKEWMINGLTNAEFSRDNNSPLSDGQLISHQPQSFSREVLFELFCMLYVDDGPFVFESRHQLKLVFPCFCGTLQSLG